MPLYYFPRRLWGMRDGASLLSAREHGHTPTQRRRLYVGSRPCISPPNCGHSDGLDLLLVRGAQLHVFTYPTRRRAERADLADARGDRFGRLWLSRLDARLGARCCMRAEPTAGRARCARTRAMTGARSSGLGQRRTLEYCRWSLDLSTPVYRACRPRALAWMTQACTRG